MSFYVILCAVATFWAMSLVGIYPVRASVCIQKRRKSPQKVNQVFCNIFSEVVKCCIREIPYSSLQSRDYFVS